MVDLKLRPCWYKPYEGTYANQWMPGEFHEWGTEMSRKKGMGTFSVGIVEDSDTRAIVTIVPKRICFSHDPEDSCEALT